MLAAQWDTRRMNLRETRVPEQGASTPTRGSSGKWVLLSSATDNYVACPDRPAGLRDSSHHRRDSNSLA
jgi:hypothetical protein